MAVEDKAPAPKAPPAANDLVSWYQERYCRPCGAGCPRGSVEMALCVQARLAQATRAKKNATTPGNTNRDGKDA